MRKLFAIFVVVGILITSALIVHGITNRTNYDDYTTITYVVKSGDTLWSICSANCFSDDDLRGNYDIRNVIHLVEEINNTTALIHPGDVLELPYYSKLYIRRGHIFAFSSFFLYLYIGEYLH